jgi:hypothetical protein
MVPPSASTSARTGVAPVRSIAATVGTHVFACVTTSSPGPSPRARSARLDRVGAGADADSMCRSGRRGELLLEGLSLATEDKPAAAQHAHEGRVELVPQLGYATAEVVERDCRGRRHGR